MSDPGDASLLRVLLDFREALEARQAGYDIKIGGFDRALGRYVTYEATLHVNIEENA